MSNNQRNRKFQYRRNNRRQVIVKRQRLPKGAIKITRSTDKMTNMTEMEVRRQMPNIHTIPRLMYTPETMLVDLVYPDVNYNRNNVGSSFLSWRYRTGNIFDPDPALGSGSVPGYTYYSNGYNAYLIIGIGYDIGIVNMEASGSDIVVCPTTQDLGLNYSSVGELFGNPHATVASVSSKGGMDRCRLTGYVDLGQFYGNCTQYIANFGTTFGSNPTTLFLNVGATSPTSYTTNNGLDVRVTLTYRVLLFSRKTQIN